jgi:hypothetical protein
MEGDRVRFVLSTIFAILASATVMEMINSILIDSLYAKSSLTDKDGKSNAMGIIVSLLYLMASIVGIVAGIFVFMFSVGLI